MRRSWIWLLTLTGLLVACDGLGGGGGGGGGGGAPVIASFTASGSVAAAGEAVTLSWTVEGDDPITLTLLPLNRDVSEQTSTEVAPEETTSYELQAANEAGSDSAEVTVQVISEGEAALEVQVHGLPASASANVAASDHDSVMSWLAGTGAVVSTRSELTVAAAPVTVAGDVYLPGLPVRSVTLVPGEVTEVEVEYSPASGQLYQSQPNVSSCEPGELTDEAKTRALARLNFVRVLVGLPAVQYQASGDGAVQEASLMFAANVDTDHDPPTSWHCYTANGANAAGDSNLAVTAEAAPFQPSPERFIDLWADDEGVPGVGHRRWLLDPFLAEVAFGLVSGEPLVEGWAYAAGSSLRIINPDDADISGLPLEFVAYPRGDFPSGLISEDWYLSFSVVANTDSRFANGSSEVDYSSATVTVEDSSGSDMSVSDVAADHTVQGIPNQLAWRVPGLEEGERYRVTISNVIVNGDPRTFEYEFRSK